VVSPPQITITSPSGGSEIEGDTATVTGTITSQSATITSATITVNDGPTVPLPIETNGTFSKAVSLKEGQNTIKIKATDSNGLTDEKSISVTRLPDETPPSISNIAVTLASGNVGTVFTITASVTDLYGGKDNLDSQQVLAHIQNPDENDIATPRMYDDGSNGDATAGDGVFTARWQSTTEGTYYVDVSARDLAGNKSEAEASSPFTVTEAPVDTAGFPLYLTRWMYGDIFKVDSNGTATKLPESANSNLRDLAFDSKGTLYVAQTNGQISTVDTSSGAVTPIAIGLSSPYGLAFDNSDTLYVSDWSDGKILTVDTSDGTVTTLTTGFSKPASITFDSSGTLYVAESGSGKISTVRTNPGEITTLATGLSAPYGLAFDSNGTLYVTEDTGGNNDRISTVDVATGTVTPLVEVLVAPRSLAFDNDGLLYVAEAGSNQISRIDVNTKAVSVFATVNGYGVMGLAFTTKQALCGDVDGDGKVTASDAVLILKHVVGLQELPPCKLSIADVSNNGNITALDAALVLQYSVGTLSEFPADQASAPIAIRNSQSYTLSIPNITAKPGSKITMPISLEEDNGLLAGEFVLAYDAKLLRLVDVHATSLNNKRNLMLGTKWRGEAIFHSGTPGTTKIVFAGTRKLKKNGVIVNVEFETLRGVRSGATISLKLTQVLLNENSRVVIKNGSIEILPTKTAMLQNFPNPFNPDTWIPYLLAEPADVVIRIYAVNGQLVRTIHLGSKQAGTYVDKNKAAYWNGRNELGEHVASNVYFYQMQAGNFSSVRKLVILK